MSNLVPEGWISSPLGDVLNKILDFRGRTPKKLGMTWGGGNIRALSANNVQMGKVNFQKECYLASLELYQQWMTKGETEKGDVLFTMEAPLGNVALVPNDDKYILSQRVILLKNDRTKILSDFLFQQMRSDSFQNVLRENATGSTALGIQQKRLVTLDVVLPPLPEQKKIAAILTSVDDVIEKTQAQIDKLKDLKTGMMQELFTRGVGVDGKPHTEFKDSPVGRIPKGWEVLPLANVVERVIDCEHKTAPYVEKSEFMVVRTSNVRSGELLFEDMKFTHSEGYSEWTKRAVPSVGDVLFTREAPAGESCLVPEGLKICMGQRMVLLRPNRELVHPCFFSMFLTSEAASKSIYELSIGTTVSRINIEDIKRIPCMLPPLDEQLKISRSIQSVQRVLDTKQRKLLSLQNNKKALMQDLLTGKVRVKVDS